MCIQLRAVRRKGPLKHKRKPHVREWRETTRRISFIPLGRCGISDDLKKKCKLVYKKCSDLMMSHFQDKFSKFLGVESYKLSSSGVADWRSTLSHRELDLFLDTLMICFITHSGFV